MKNPHVILTLLALLANPLAAHAYVDPGAGSMLLQLLLGGAAGAFVFFRLFKQRLYRLLGFRKQEK